MDFAFFLPRGLFLEILRGEADYEMGFSEGADVKPLAEGLVPSEASSSWRHIAFSVDRSKDYEPWWAIIARV